MVRMTDDSEKASELAEPLPLSDELKEKIAETMQRFPVPSTSPLGNRVIDGDITEQRSRFTVDR